MHDHPRLHVVDPEILVGVIAEGLDDRDGGALRLGLGELSGELLGMKVLQDAIGRLNELARLLGPPAGDLGAQARAGKPGDDRHPDQGRDGDDLDLHPNLIEHSYFSDSANQSGKLYQLSLNTA